MFRNYFYLGRTAFELTSELKNFEIVDIYTQEKDILFLDVTNSEIQKTLVISTNPQIPYYYVKENHKKAKKNVISYFRDSIPSKIDSISISDKDRILKFETEGFDLFFTIRGPKTNVLFKFTDSTISSFKKTDDDYLRSFFVEISEQKFLRNKNDILFNLFDNKTLEEIQNDKRINRRIWLEYKSKFRDDVQITQILQVVSQIFDSKIRILVDDELAKVDFQFENWESEIHQSQVYDFNESNLAIAKFISLHHKYSIYSRTESDLSKKIEKDLAFWSEKLNNLKARIELGSQSEKYSLLANLLLANIYQIKKGMGSIVVEDYSNGESIEIKLNPKIEPNKNVDHYFEKSRDEKINFAKSIEIFEQSKAKYLELKDLQNEINKSESLQNLNQIGKNLLGNKSKEKTKMEDEKIKYKKYIVEQKYSVFVGKDSESNDRLTFNFAKQNDLWFHARGLAGSHTVLRIENTKEVIPKSVIKKAASIAAFFSKGKTASLVPVSYTFRKFVRKSKGMLAGQVFITNESVVIVTPEIPKDAEEIYE